MSSIHFFLAQDDVAELIHTAAKPGAMTVREILTLVATFSVAIILAVVIVIWFWKKGKSGRRRKRRHRSPEERLESEGNTGRRRRRRSERPMNPTLAQTGGLPPRREAGVPPPPMP